MLSVELRLDLSRSLWENLGDYHERAKKLKRKIAKLEELIKNPPKREERGAEQSVQLLRKRRRDWYEKFRWAFTRNGLLVIAGRDARTNEIIVRKYLEDKDLFFHADLVGAPATVLKGGQDATGDDILDAAVIAASYSRAWKAGWPSVDVFYVPPDQVSLAPPSGEFRPKGGVMIYGEKRWVRKVPLMLYFGYDSENDRVFASPHAVGGAVAVVPGDQDKSIVAKKILARLGISDRRDLYDDLMAILPPGESKVLERASQ